MITQEELEKAVLAERERCIAICRDFLGDDDVPRKPHETYLDGWQDACNEIMWSIEKPDD